jgi:programmed cell death 8 (apoptosis-inducing factor)
VLLLGPALLLLDRRNTPPEDPPKHPFAEYVLIGAGTAAFNAMQTIRKHDQNAKVLIISDQQHVPYQLPPLSKELWFEKHSNNFTYKDWEGKTTSIFYQPEESYNVVDIKNIESTLSKNDHSSVYFLKNCTVSKIDADKKLLTIGNKKIRYSKVLIATGGSPKTLPFEISENIKKNLMTFRTLEDFKKLEKLATAQGTQKIAIIGGGFLGSELSVALAQKKNVQVVQIVPEEGILI